MKSYNTVQNSEFGGAATILRRGLVLVSCNLSKVCTYDGGTDGRKGRGKQLSAWGSQPPSPYGLAVGVCT